MIVQSVDVSARDFIRQEEGFPRSGHKSLKTPSRRSSKLKTMPQPGATPFVENKAPNGNAALAAARREAAQIAADIKSENLKLELSKRSFLASKGAKTASKGAGGNGKSSGEMPLNLQNHYDHAEPLPDVSEDDGWKHLGWEYKHIKGDPQEVEAATASIQKRLLDRLINHSKMLKNAVSGELWHQEGIGTPEEHPGVESSVWKALTAVGRVFKSFDLDRTMSKAYFRAHQVFNMSDNKDCDSRCIHTVSCVRVIEHMRSVRAWVAFSCYERQHRACTPAPPLQSECGLSTSTNLPCRH